MQALNLKGLRKLKNMTQNDICKVLKVEQGTISKWETGKSLPDIETVFKLAKILNCTIEELFTEVKR